jgi:hypothetical protein
VCVCVFLYQPTPPSFPLALSHCHTACSTALPSPVRFRRRRPVCTRLFAWRRDVSYTKVKALPAGLGKCTKLEKLCAPRPLRTRRCDGREPLAAAPTHTPRVPNGRAQRAHAVRPLWVAVRSCAMLGCACHMHAQSRTGARRVWWRVRERGCGPARARAGVRLGPRSRRCRARRRGRSCKSCARGRSAG